MRAETRYPLPHGHALFKGTYRIELDDVVHGVGGQPLGSGAFGITYRAMDNLSRTVVIKEFFPAGCRRKGMDIVPSGNFSAELFGHFKQKALDEGATLGRLEHEGIVRVYFCFEENNTVYLVMEYIEGDTLDDYYKLHGRLSVTEATRLISEIARALKRVHAVNLLHRDIKPDNIMIRNGKPILIDFGAAREYIPGAEVTMTFTLTPGYAPPEQYLKKAEWAPSLDIYALSATLYTLLTSEPPQRSDMREKEDLVRPPHELRSDVSLALSNMVMRGMALDALKRQQNIEEFLNELDMAIKPPIHETPKPEEGTGESFFETGKNRYECGDYMEAVIWLRKALEVSPGKASYHNWLGHAHYELNDHENAKLRLTRAIELDPKSASAYNNLGILYKDQKQYAEAEKMYRKAIELDPKSAVYHNNLGILYKDQKQYTEAEKMYRKAIELDPKNDSAYNRLGNLYHDQKQYTEAEKMYRKAIELDPKSAVYHNNLGILYKDQKQYTEAEKMYRKAIELDPKSAVYYVSLACALYQQQRLDEAKQYAVRGKNLGYSEHWIYQALEQDSKSWFDRFKDGLFGKTE